MECIISCYRKTGPEAGILSNFDIQCEYQIEKSTISLIIHHIVKIEGLGTINIEALPCVKIVSASLTDLGNVMPIESMEIESVDRQSIIIRIVCSPDNLDSIMQTKAINIIAEVE